MFKVKLIRGEGFTDKEWNAQLESAYWWEKCWNNPEFQRDVLDYGYDLQRCTGALWWKKCSSFRIDGFTYSIDNRVSILSNMLLGKELLKPDEDGTADVEIIVGNQRGVLGWTYPNVLIEWVSRWFIDSASIAEIAGNRAHEYMHKLGYDHPFRATWDRPYSVPYAVGNLTADWVKTHFISGEFKLS